MVCVAALEEQETGRLLWPLFGKQLVVYSTPYLWKSWNQAR
jgi:hypothetical protein